MPTKRKNSPKRKNKARKNPPRNSVRLTNFTGKVARTASGQVQVQGVQMKKANPAKKRNPKKK